MKSKHSVFALAIAIALAMSTATASTQAAGPAPTVMGNEPLAPGKFVWDATSAAAGPLLVAVNLDEQMAYVYRNGVRIARSTVSSGKEGHDTPTGVFSILQKNKDHYSKNYNGAPMPYMNPLLPRCNRALGAQVRSSSAAACGACCSAIAANAT